MSTTTREAQDLDLALRSFENEMEVIGWDFRNDNCMLNDWLVSASSRAETQADAIRLRVRYMARRHTIAVLAAQRASDALRAYLEDVRFVAEGR